jgi:signal transduction histidine kinase
VDLGRLIAEAVTLLRERARGGARAPVDFAADRGPHVCMADPDQILQVFWNLTAALLEHAGGGVLRCGSLLARQEILLSFRDNGKPACGS